MAFQSIKMLSPAQVLELIDPVDPDKLMQTAPGVWTAQWHPPVLGGDLEALRRTPGIDIVKDEYEPEGLPGWVAVKFVVVKEGQLVS
ncbi:MAG: hypothetical protein FOGNACKC_00736 [Anaerolineae bacterium]|nr:hypothetical protein [Anaerolineae bacterium]